MCQHGEMQLQPFLKSTFMDQLSGPFRSVFFTDPSVKKFYPVRSVKYTENIVIEVNILQLDALPETNSETLSKSSYKNWIFFPEAPLFKIVWFSPDLFILSACVPFAFLSSDTVQELNLPILNLEITFGLKQVYLEKIPENLRPGK